MLDVFKIYLPDSKEPIYYTGNFEDACVRIKGKTGAAVADIRGKVLARYKGPAYNGNASKSKASVGRKH